MSNTKSSRIVVVFKRFERFWHWAQALIILILLLTGFEMHGLFPLFGFASAAETHNIIGFVLAGLLVLIYTWILTTGEWQQYFPTLKGVEGTLRFYLWGVFKGEKNPHHLTPEDKFNPLQRLGYVFILFGLLMIQVISGLAFYFFPDLRAAGIIAHVDLIAILHTLNAYALLSFVVIHLYMITTGNKLTTHLKAMLTGKVELDTDNGK